MSQYFIRLPDKLDDSIHIAAVKALQRVAKLKEQEH